MWYSCDPDKNNCDCDGLRECGGEWCQGSPGDREGCHYPYDDNDDTFNYDPANDDMYDDHYPYVPGGYPAMIDPATGLVYGIDPETDDYYDMFSDDGWPMDEDDWELDPA